jgi:protein phosphatase
VIPTNHRRVDTSDPATKEAAIDWWEELAAAGGEGIVVKPEDPISRGRRRVIQPGLKIRAREYLRIMYGPEYTLPENFGRLRERSLGRKRSLAVREFALGVEALDRFVRGEPLYRIHECVFGILALDSEPWTRARRPVLRYWQGFGEKRWCPRPGWQRWVRRADSSRQRLPDRVNSSA